MPEKYSLYKLFKQLLNFHMISEIESGMRCRHSDLDGITTIDKQITELTQEIEGIESYNSP